MDCCKLRGHNGNCLSKEFRDVESGKFKKEFARDVAVADMVALHVWDSNTEARSPRGSRGRRGAAAERDKPWRHPRQRGAVAPL